MAKETPASDPSRLIAMLNALGLGDLESISAKLEEVRASCAGLGHEELADKLEEASRALRAGDVRTYRRNVETVVSRLGHLR